MSLRATRAEISLPKLAANLAVLRRRLRRHAGVPRLCLVVKGNAYGHGLAGLSRAAREQVDCFAVATVDEGEILRSPAEPRTDGLSCGRGAGITRPILLLSPHLRREIPRICELGLEPLISSAEFLADYQREAAKAGHRLRLHLKVDSGMGRCGAVPGKIVQLARHCASYPALELYGLCTHFASADLPDEEGRTEAQLRCFREVIAQLRREGIQIPCIHAANSAAALHYPDSHFDMVRIGIAAYGACEYPGSHRATTAGTAQSGELQALLSLKSKISLVRRVPRGARVSYGGTWQAPCDSLLGLLPIGYADGYSRLLSNCGQVWVAGPGSGGYCPVVGRVCMDLTVIDLSDFALRQCGATGLLERDVELLGSRPQLRAQDLAAQCQTIAYEVLTSISARVPRLYTEEN